MESSRAAGEITRLETHDSGHCIRLRGPWKFQRLDETGAPRGDRGTLKHPEEWPKIAGVQSGRIELTRNFHAPSNLDPHETVIIRLTGVRGEGAVRLNGKLLGRFDARVSACEFICPLPLPFSNVLTIDVAFSAETESGPHVGVSGVVELVIRTTG